MSASESGTIYIDGSCSGNPGPAGIGLVIYDGEDDTAIEHHEPIGTATNNIAEYKAAIKALQQALELGYRRVTVYSDSQLLCRQVSGRYRVKSPNLMGLHVQLRKLMRRFDDVTFEHVEREKNERADGLARQATLEAKVDENDNSDL